MGTGNEIHKRPQVGAGNVDDVITLLAQRPGHRRVPVHRDVHDGDAHAEILYLGDDLGEILLGAYDDSGADRAVPVARDQLPVHLSLDALTSARAYPAEPDLEPGKAGQR